MANSAARSCLAVALGLALAACGAGKAPELVNPNIFPTAYRQDILDTLKNTLDDPTNVREALISDPVLTALGSDQRYTACVRYNARDVNRVYVGVKERVAYFFGGRLNQLVEADKGQCAKAAYKPFPELETLCYAKKCS
ncbi:MAG: hypothetical protein ACREB2_04715 [Pseudolabrys sp.]